MDKSDELQLNTFNELNTWFYGLIKDVRFLQKNVILF